MDPDERWFANGRWTGLGNLCGRLVRRGVANPASLDWSLVAIAQATVKLELVPLPGQDAHLCVNVRHR
ncbi:hypothetical protein K227x_29480 [Rubripirellula lacrimiformis]|uniref:Uncharacterized protein n=1 Tax=Rubripirellula lacrimiformis TaxID=1930273 RepID=A0A517NBN6_9BACT|nr:hypothetical protein K227x_29480 [Rubripirellula lacrimiformis]